MPLCTAPVHALLHAVDCIRWQGPLCGYWCFGLERFGGWIKSFAWRNNKDVVSWINNQLVQREQVCPIQSVVSHISTDLIPTAFQMIQLSLMLDRKDVRVVEAWEDYMNGKSSYQRIWHSRDQPERPDYTPACFSKPAAAGWTMSGGMLRAIALHLETRRYNDNNYHAGQDYRPDLRLLAATHFTAWDAYDSSSDDGEQRYRCERLFGTGDGVRDASWATVSTISPVCYHELADTDPICSTCKWWIRTSAIATVMQGSERSSSGERSSSSWSSLGRGRTFVWPYCRAIVRKPGTLVLLKFRGGSRDVIGGRTGVCRW